MKICGENSEEELINLVIPPGAALIIKGWPVGPMGSSICLIYRLLI